MPELLKYGYKAVRFYFRDILYNRNNRKRLTNHDFSIICSDCTGGCVCKDLKMQMKSPTRNFYFDAHDYISFCNNLKYYLDLPLTSDKQQSNTVHLTAMCGDIRLYLVHYDSFEQAKAAWKRKKKRVNFSNIFFLMNDRNGCTEADIKAFDELPYENKVCFTHKQYPQYRSAFYISGSEDDVYLKSLTDYTPKWRIKRYYDQFDFIAWFNEGGCNWK